MVNTVENKNGQREFASAIPMLEGLLPVWHSLDCRYQSRDFLEVSGSFEHAMNAMMQTAAR
jgi:hypothetical protein